MSKVIYEGNTRVYKGSGNEMPMMSTGHTGLTITVAPASTSSYSGNRVVEFNKSESFDADKHDFELRITPKFAPSHWTKRLSSYSGGGYGTVYRAATKADADYYKSYGYVEVKVEAV